MKLPVQVTLLPTSSNTILRTSAGGHDGPYWRLKPLSWYTGLLLCHEEEQTFFLTQKVWTRPLTNQYVRRAGKSEQLYCSYCVKNARKVIYKMNTIWIRFSHGVTSSPNNFSSINAPCLFLTIPKQDLSLLTFVYFGIYLLHNFTYKWYWS